MTQQLEETTPLVWMENCAILAQYKEYLAKRRMYYTYVRISTLNVLGNIIYSFS